MVTSKTILHQKEHRLPEEKADSSLGQVKVDNLKTPVCSKNQENVQHIVGPAGIFDAFSCSHWTNL